MPPDRDAAGVHDMLGATRHVVEFTRGISHEEFFKDAKTQSAVIHQVLVLGEACKRLSEGFRTAHPQVPWHLIARTRDILIHRYESVDLEEVWRIASRDIPSLLPALRAMVDGLGS